MTVKSTFCRICFPNCPINATIDDAGQVTHLAPNPDHPMGGTPCNVGLSFLDVHHSPDRLNWPLKRQNPRGESQGEFERQDWDTIFSEIGTRLRRLRDEHGVDSIAFYGGNPGFFDSRAVTVYGQMVETFGSNMVFSANTQDGANKVRGAMDLYGSVSIMVPDLINTNYLLCIGANPKVSHWTGLSNPNDPLKVLKEMKARGGKTVFVNPRKIESSTPETGETLQIKPGTDVYLLAAVLNEIVRNNGVKHDVVGRHGKNTKELFEFCAQYPTERVVAVTGISAEDIRQIASDLTHTDGSSVYTGTGINQGHQGLLTHWLAEMINFVTGNLGRLGGCFNPSGFFNHKPAVAISDFEPISTSIGEFIPPKGGMFLPAVAMPDLIEAGDIKALIVFTGNPLLSIGGEQRMRKAFEKLDTLIIIDIHRNATAELADYVLSATDWLERADVNFSQNGWQLKQPFIQYTDPIARPAEGRREDWWILSRLAQELEVPSLLDDPQAAQEGFAIIDRMLAVGGYSLEKVKTAEHQVVSMDPEPYEALFERCLQHPDKKIDCCPPTYQEHGLFKRCEEIFDALEREAEDTLKLVSLRTIYMHNSWMANSPTLRKGMQSHNPLHISTADAEVRGLYDGETVMIHNENGCVEAILCIDDNMRQGVVAMSHGYGNHDTHGMKIASDRPGTNCNQLLPTSLDSVEPLSYMSWMNAVPVSVSKR